MQVNTKRPARTSAVKGWPADSVLQDDLIVEVEPEKCLGSNPRDKKDYGPKSPICRRANRVEPAPKTEIPWSSRGRDWAEAMG